MMQWDIKTLVQALAGALTEEADKELAQAYSEGWEKDHIHYDTFRHGFTPVLTRIVILKREKQKVVYQAPDDIKPRVNWVHHVDCFTDGSVGIDRYGEVEPRKYHPTPASQGRLERATLMWRHYGATKQQFAEGLRDRVMAPMRRPDGRFS